ncbi:hypothetical protein GF362_01520 [Candidatus Dojkabacteria bacterium]|nr:hypothetical protein [Candidatus Dojkabacteria bacterium]
MTNFNEVFTKWLAFFESADETKKDVFESIHPEVKKGFDVVTRVSKEEIQALLNNEEFLKKIEQNLIRLLAFSVFGGYMLFCIRKGIDPVKESLKDNENVAKVGNSWMEAYKQDNFKSLIQSIEPLVVLMVEKGKQARMNQLIMSFPEIMNLSFKDGLQIDKFMRWAGLQGYILGMLEQELIKGKGNLKEA